MNSFSSAVMQRHMGQTDAVVPRPVGLYESTQKIGIEAQEQIEQSNPDAEYNTQTTPINAVNRINPQFEVQTPYQSHSEDLSNQKEANTRLSYTLDARDTPQLVPSQNSDELKPFAPLIPAPVQSVATPRTTDNDLKDNDSQPKKTEQLVQLHLIQPPNERQIVTHTEPIIKSENAVNIVQPATTTTNFGSQTPSNQSERFTAPPPKMNEPPSTPIVKVSIGRIEVKAVVQTPSQPAKSNPPSKPRMSLDEYLKKQDNPAK